MKKLIVLLTSIFMTFTLMAKSQYDHKFFSQIPIHSEGRVKPLDTFARVNLLLIYEKSKLKDMSAIEWLAELLFEPETAYSRRIFRIRNKEVVNTLNLKFDKSHLYSFLEVSPAIKKADDLISQINSIPKKQRSPSQQQTFELYFKVANVFEISRSLSLLIPKFTMPNKDYAKKLDLPFGKQLTYLQVLKRKALYSELVQTIFDKKDSGSTEEQTALLKMGSDLEKIAADFNTRLLRIVPPQFEKNMDKEWTSPWQTLQQGLGTPLTVKYFKLWSKLFQAYHSKDLDQWQEASMGTLLYSQELSTGVADKSKQAWEVKYSKYDLFTKALSFYILAFLLLCFSWLFMPKKLEIAALGSLTLGCILHLVNLITRMYIMGRPPVSTLYESVIFVSLICVFSAVMIEFRSRTNMGTFIGSILGTILLFVSFSYEKDGDSMGMLAAVLDTNFWLATHVVTITIGYGCCFVASILGHTYLFQKIMEKLGKKSTQFDSQFVKKNMHGASLFSLFFTVLGTILGGIWADQSWGRFWGWDPKENGAMLICMWVLWAVHGKMTKYFDDVAYATAISLTSIIVVLAWFGVNLLNVGLHSYGFTSSIANNIAAFTAVELILIFGAFSYLRLNKRVQV